MRTKALASIFLVFSFTFSSLAASPDEELIAKRAAESHGVSELIVGEDPYETQLREKRYFRMLEESERTTLLKPERVSVSDVKTSRPCSRLLATLTVPALVVGTFGAIMLSPALDEAPKQKTAEPMSDFHYSNALFESYSRMIDQNRDQVRELKSELATLGHDQGSDFGIQTRRREIESRIEMLESETSRLRDLRMQQLREKR